MKKFVLIFFLIFYTYRVESQFTQCSTGEVCKPFNDCDELKRLAEKGFLTPQERDLLRTKQCNSINRVAYVCCGTRSFTPTRPPQVPQPSNSRSKFPKPPTCGVSQGNRIYGGELTEIDEHPWTVQLWYQKPQGTGSHCGGSLINERYVLTAAHCEKKVPRTWRLFQVRLGDWDTRTNPDCQQKTNERVCNDPHVDVPIEKIIVHESYNPDSRSQYHDIALLRMQRDVTFTEFIVPICLPTDTGLRSLKYTNKELEVVGFGKTETENSSANKLKVTLNALSDQQCQAKYSHLGLIEGQLCAGGEAGKDSCNGDSGGPLVRYQSYDNYEVQYYMLVGLVSFGPKNCGTRDQPGVYTSVGEYMQWIEANVR